MRPRGVQPDPPRRAKCGQRWPVSASQPSVRTRRSACCSSRSSWRPRRWPGPAASRCNPGTPGQERRAGRPHRMEDRVQPPREKSAKSRKSRTCDALHRRLPRRLVEGTPPPDGKAPSGCRHPRTPTPQDPHPVRSLQGRHGFWVTLYRVAPVPGSVLRNRGVKGKNRPIRVRGWWGHGMFGTPDGRPPPGVPPDKLTLWASRGHEKWEWARERAFA